MGRQKVERKIKRRKRFIKFCLFIIVIGISITIMLKSNYFVVDKIEINNNKYVKKEEIIALCDVKGKNIFLLRKDNISEKIKNNPYIEKVNIKKKLPSTIIINVQEKR